MIKLIVLFLLCNTIYAGNDTINNEIPKKAEVEETWPEKQEAAMGDRTVGEIFNNAVQAYLEENWGECIEGFNAALHGYKLYKRMVVNCRQKCRAKASGSQPIFAENIEDLHFYEKKVRETLCLLTCNQDYREIAGSKALKKLPVETEKKFVDHTIYEYLHLCYYQKGRHQDAANAIFTFLAMHPDHEVSAETLRQYLALPDVKEENIINLEAPPYLTMYFKGVAAYDEENYAEASSLFENSLKSYLHSEEQCRIYCEGPFDQGWHPEFTSSIANHFAYCLKCKRSCSHLLNMINGNYHNDMLWSHYNYLQFSYYKLGNLKEACAAVASYLSFLPADGTMLQNKKYYEAQPKVKEEYFTPRDEALVYVKRQEYEMRLLRYIIDEFSTIDTRVKAYTKKQKKKNKNEDRGEESGKISKTALHPPPGHSPSFLSQLTTDLSIVRDAKEVYDTERPRVKANVHLIAEEEKLSGKNRYVADGFLNDTECQSLMDLALTAAVEGDGYEENKSPHSVYEQFEGITVGRVALMVYLGQATPEQLELLLESTEAARNHVDRYFRLDRELYFTYTHLVCRTALPDSPLDRKDLSHEVHADNCLLKDQNTCSRESPAYIWRDYSAILYLNDDFEGGEFFFARDRTSREPGSIVLPRCGRMVAFSAGEENLHGVRGVLKGRRCALALWFTQDKKYIEHERVLARAILKRVRSMGPSQQRNLQVPLMYEDVLLERFKKDKLLRQLLQNS